MICPADQELRFIGRYQDGAVRAAYRLYGHGNCTACPLKAQCTDRKSRRLKVPEMVATSSSTAADPSKADNTSTDKTRNRRVPRAPSERQASLTEPEAVMMLATSEKRWEPSYNADLTVTRHGIIISQFLTKETTDFHNFEPALEFVLANLDKPDCWIGDGHYSTFANLVVAHRKGLVLYAGSAEQSSSDAPAVPAAAGHSGHSEDLPPLPLTTSAQQGESRSVNTPSEGPQDLPSLVHALDKRMQELGDRVMRFRRQTVELVNAHIKQHGLGRFHVHGFSRCRNVLTLACIAHNLLKWKARVAAQALTKLAA
jgi:hypothetical protein